MKLYKYREFDSRGRWRQILTDNQLYFARPSALNDPFECRPLVVAEGSPDEIAAYARKVAACHAAHCTHAKQAELVQAMIDRLTSPNVRSETYYDLVGRYGVLSFASEPDNALLWTHYGGNHEGFCLQFELHEGDPNPAFGGVSPVRYSRDRPVVDVLKTRDPEAAETLFDNGLLTKSADWAYEKEYRSIRLDGPGLVAFAPSVLTGVILGARISAEHREEFLGLLRGREPVPRVLQAALDAQHYKLNLEPVAL